MRKGWFVARVAAVFVLPAMAVGTAFSRGTEPFVGNQRESPGAGAWFADKAQEAGLDFMHFNGMSGEFYFPEHIGPGAGLLDYDDDGDLDVFLVQGQMLGVGDTVTIVHVTSGVGDRAVDQRFCHEVQPWLANLQLKLNGNVPLPGDFMMSATFVNVAGEEILADYSATNAEIAASLGRPLSGGASTVQIPLIAPYTQYEGRRVMLDVRLSRVFDIGSAGRLNANIDLYNVFNANTILGRVNTYGPRWGLPTRILPGRMVQVGARLTF